MGSDALPVRCGCGHSFEIPPGASKDDTVCPKCGDVIVMGAVIESPSPPPVPVPTARESKLGKVALEKGWLKQEDLDRAVRFQSDKAARGETLRLGEALVQLSLLTGEQVRQALLLQDKIQMRCPTCKKSYNVRGYKHGTKVMCKGCNTPVVLVSDALDLHTDTGPGLRTSEDKAAVDPELFDLIPGYAIEQKLGSGGMGDVYLARQASLDRQVAVKILPADLAKNRTYVERFISEAKSAARLMQENIVAALDAGESKGRYYFIMEYVQGETLQQILQREGAISEKRVLQIARQVATGLRHAQKQGLIHRDIKPGNVMITVDGTAKICDFGLARRIEESEGGADRERTVLSSPPYASPEQCRGRKDVDHRSDMYSLGVTLFEALTGQRPFKADTIRELFLHHTNTPPPDPRSLNASMSPGTNEMVLRLLRKAPEERYPEYDEFLEALNRKSQVSSLPRSTRRRTAPVEPEGPPKPLWQQPKVIKLAAGAFAALIGIIVVFKLINMLGNALHDGGPSGAPVVQKGPDPRVAGILEELKQRQEGILDHPGQIPDIRQAWRRRVEEHRGTLHHPVFAAGMEEFESEVNTQAGVMARRVLQSVNSLILTGREAEALEALRTYPAGFAGTDGASRIALRESELRAQLEEMFRTQSDEVASRVVAGKFDEARTGLAALKARVSVPGADGDPQVLEAFGQRLADLTKSIREEELIAKARGRVPDPATGKAAPRPAEPDATPPSPAPRSNLPVHFEVLFDPAKRADADARRVAVDVFRRSMKNSSFSRAAVGFLGRSDKEWGLVEKGPALGALQAYFSTLEIHRVASMPPESHHRIFVELSRAIAACGDANVEALRVFACAHLDEALSQENFRPDTGAMVRAGLVHTKALNLWGAPEDFERVAVARLLFTDGNLLERQRIARKLAASGEERDQLLGLLFELSQGTFDPYTVSEKWRRASARAKDARIVSFLKQATEFLKGLRKCEPCKGNGKVVCVKCKGQAIIPCPPCKGTGSIPQGFFGDTIPCKTCKQKAKIICTDCRGARKTKCAGCDGKRSRRSVPVSEAKELLNESLCRECEGDGSLFFDVAFPCPPCEGSGRFPTE